MKKKIVSLALVVAMLAIAVIGGTMAYFTDTDRDDNVMTVGNFNIIQNEYEYNYDEEKFQEFTQNKPALPAVFANGEKTAPVAAEDKVTLNGKEMNYWSNTENANIIDKYITVKNEGNTDIYFRTILAVEIGDIDMNSSNAGVGMTRYLRTMSNYDATADLSDDNFEYVRTYLTDANDQVVTIEIDGQKYMFIIWTHKTTLAANTESAPSLRQICLGHGLNSKQVASLGDTWDIVALSQAIQASGFDSADAALKAGFGEATAENVAKWFGGTVVAE